MLLERISLCPAVKVCGGDWSMHNSATGGYYRCNRFAQSEEEAIIANESSGGGLLSFLGGLVGKIQVSSILV
jgi:hypothetical protein